MVNGFLYIVGAFIAIAVDLFLEKRRKPKRFSSIDHSLNELKKAVKELSSVSNQVEPKEEKRSGGKIVELARPERELLQVALKLYTTEWGVFSAIDKKYTTEDMAKIAREIGNKLA